MISRVNAYFLSVLGILMVFAVTLSRAGMPMSFERSLEQLAPENPERYGVLAERLMLHNDPAKLKLAQQLLIRAIFWGDQNSEYQVASTACIAHSELGVQSVGQTWLWDLE